MLTALLVTIFISFIGVGLPDSVLGTAWPAIYRDLGLPISMAGYITATVSIGTITSSLCAAWLIKRLGTGLLTAISTLLTVIALFGFAFTSNPAFFFLLALPLGLGAGSIDTALNSFVALHYSAGQTSLLHCFYGVGVASTPFIMSLALGDGNNWRQGYITVAIIQSVITAVAFISLPLWHKIQKKDAEEQKTEKRTLSIPALIRTPGVLLSGLCFFGSCALELSAGAWCSSFFVNTKGLPADNAAIITMLLYIGLSLGRLLSSIFAARLGRRRLLRISLITLIFAVFIFALPLPMPISAAAVFLIGLGIGPIYPNLVHLTPSSFGADIAESVMGFQQALTYLSIMIMPWLFGVLADTLTTAILPYYLIAMLAIYTTALTLFMRSLKRIRQKKKESKVE